MYNFINNWRQNYYNFYRPKWVRSDTYGLRLPNTLEAARQASLCASMSCLSARSEMVKTFTKIGFHTWGVPAEFPLILIYRYKF